MPDAATTDAGLDSHVRTDGRALGWLGAFLRRAASRPRLPLGIRNRLFCAAHGHDWTKHAAARRGDLLIFVTVGCSRCWVEHRYRFNTEETA
jgi:hypothetical protein